MKSSQIQIDSDDFSDAHKQIPLKLNAPPNFLTSC